MDWERISVRTLKAHLSAVLRQVERTGRPVTVTAHGRPVAQVSAPAEGALPPLRVVQRAATEPARTVPLPRERYRKFLRALEKLEREERER